EPGLRVEHLVEVGDRDRAAVDRDLHLVPRPDRSEHTRMPRRTARPTSAGEPDAGVLPAHRGGRAEHVGRSPASAFAVLTTVRSRHSGPLLAARSRARPGGARRLRAVAALAAVLAF